MKVTTNFYSLNAFSEYCYSSVVFLDIFLFPTLPNVVHSGQGLSGNISTLNYN